MRSSAVFFSGVRSEFYQGKMSQGHVDGLNCILTNWKGSGFTDLRWLAYMLATTYHETGKTMLPIEEWGKGKGRPYGKMIRMDGKPYVKPNQIYFGRGYVQLTWYENYLNMGKILGIDLLNNPHLALDPHIAAKIMFEGMTTSRSYRGDFTGKSLEQYFTSTKTDWKNARRIINGMDKADLIAGYAEDFYRIIKQAA